MGWPDLGDLVEDPCDGVDGTGRKDLGEGSAVLVGGGVEPWRPLGVGPPAAVPGIPVAPPH